MMMVGILLTWRGEGHATDADRVYRWQGEKRAVHHWEGTTEVFGNLATKKRWDPPQKLIHSKYRRSKMEKGRVLGWDLGVTGVRSPPHSSHFLNNLLPPPAFYFPHLITIFLCLIFFFFFGLEDANVKQWGVFFGRKKINSLFWTYFLLNIWIISFNIIFILPKNPLELHYTAFIISYLFIYNITCVCRHYINI